MVPVGTVASRDASPGRRALRWGLAILAVAAGATGALGAAAYLTLRASLPRLDGGLFAAGLAAPVTLERDALGVVTITAANRADLAFGTGFAHGQDRFFQMDLARRLAAGELSELAGPGALAQDLRTRAFRFRAVAREALAAATPQQRTLLEAYTRGVNAGLASLRSRPWEYWLLRARPQPWRAEDSVLVVFAMWWQLQSGDFERQQLKREIDARLGGPVCAGGWKCALEFLYPARTVWDAPNVADEAAMRADAAKDAAPPAVPGPEAIDVRAREAEGVAGTDARRPAGRAADVDVANDRDLGSNGWAVAGRLTASGAALVASDMHLPLGVPPTWYRVRLRIASDAPHAAPSRDLNGITLPGAPALVAGSNGHVAWAFTNSDGAWVDVRRVTCLAVDDRHLSTPEGDVPLSTVVERIHVRGRADVLLPVRRIAAGPPSGPQATAPSTPWQALSIGPAPALLLEADPATHRCWIGSWIAESPAATNMSLLDFERATSVKEVLALAPQVGIPEQNLVVGDRAGHIGWTIAGRVPVRRGGDEASDDAARSESLARSGAADPGAASPWLTGDAAPHLYDPPIGRVWTANARPIDDPAALAAIGGEDAALGALYDLGARAQQIRDALLRLETPAVPADMLRIELDDRAVFLARWRDLMLRLLDREALTGRPQRAQMRRLLVDWDARASVDSVGYRLVRAFHDRTEHAVWGMILRSLGIGVQAAHEPAPPLQIEQALWALVTRRPLHWLGTEYPDWRAFLIEQIDATAAVLAGECGSLARCRWGAAHPVHIRHPLSRAVPLLARFIDLPVIELPGDHEMPRVQDGAFGASERFAVSPGHEDRGYLQLPGGQSDHPLSPYYRAGFAAWAEGKPSPLLPGSTEHRFLLQPAPGSRPGLRSATLRP